MFWLFVLLVVCYVVDFGLFDLIGGFCLCRFGLLCFGGFRLDLVA